MKYKLNLGAWNGVFAVPAAVADNYIKLASGDNLKVLLFFLRWAGEALGDGEISRATGVDEESIGSSLDFWAQRGVITLNAGETTEITPSDKTGSINLSVKRESDIARAVISASVERVPQYTSAEITGAVNGSDELKYLVERYSRISGVTNPSRNTLNTLVAIIDDFGMKPEVLLMLVEYCFSVEKSSPAYMRKIAAGWIEQGINTVESADEKIKELNRYSSAENDVKQYLEIKTALSDKQKEYIKKWSGEYGFKVEMIYEAYQKALDNTGKGSFAYMDGILRKWREDGIKTKDCAARAREAFIEKKKTDDKPSYDLDALKKQLREQNKSMGDM